MVASWSRIVDNFWCCYFAFKETLWRETSEKPDSNLPEGAVVWEPETEEGGSWKASFKLGDFVNLGAFLQSISGIKGLRRSSNE